MKSPFPGMDPYLETRWGDVHASLTIYSRDLLNRLLPPGLFARAEERAIISFNEFSQRDIIPDVAVQERTLPSPQEITANIHTEPELAESVTLTLDEPEIRQRYLEIRDARSHGRVVTVIEFVSPTNKRPGDGLDKYLQKRQECLDGDANLVEIDLTRAGDRTLILPRAFRNLAYRATYLGIVHRATQQKVLQLYWLPLTKCLGGIPIPLRPSDPDIVLDLQQVINQVYENGRFEQDLNYDEPLNPPLNQDERTWARNRLASWNTESNA